MKRLLYLLIVLGIACANGSNHVFGDESADLSDGEAAIRKMVAAYVEAFNKHDAKGVADHWSFDAVYLDRDSGEEVTGREAIQKQFADLFGEQPELKIEVTIDSIQFVSPNVALERGMTRFISPGEEPEEVEYTAVEVRRDGQWLLDRVTDASQHAAISRYEQLKPLEWMVGDWTSDAEGAEVEVECDWTKNRSFLARKFAISIDDEITASGLQMIGWDPAAKAIRSWTFDANGTFAEAIWELRDGRWFIANRGTLFDGRAATMINVLKPIDADSFTWQTIERTAGDELLPNIDEIKLIRR